MVNIITRLIIRDKMKKKLFGFLLMLCGIFFIASCEEKIDIQFEITENIKIELEDFSNNYDFSGQVQVLKNGEAVPYSDLSIHLAEGESLSLGKHTFVVVYEFKKKYQESFTVQFVDEYSNVKIHFLTNESTLRIQNGKALSSLTIHAPIQDYTIEGLYQDASYSLKIDMNTTVQQDMEVYARLTYEPSYTWQAANRAEVVSNLDAYIATLIENTSSYKPAWNQEGFKGRWNYIDGVFLNSIVNLYYGTGNASYKDFFLKYINYYITTDGAFVHPEDPKTTGYRSGELDSVCESRILFDAYEMSADQRYLTAIEYTYSELMKMTIAQGTKNFSHKESYLNQIWLDGMYMYVPFLARYAKAKNDMNTFDTIKEQYEYIRNHMFDEQKKLYYHGHDTTKSIFWADKATGNSQSFWLRSNGWFIVSLVDVLEYYPEGSNKTYLKALLKEALEGILEYKDSKTNLFYQLVDKGPTAYLVPKEYLSSLKNTAYGSSDAIIRNYLETSGSSMIAYALLKASRLGYMDSSYQEVGKAIFEGIYGYSYKNGSLENICITAGLGPANNTYRDGTVQYYLAEPVGKDDAKGVGPFLMAYLEYANL